MEVLLTRFHDFTKYLYSVVSRSGVLQVLDLWKLHGLEGHKRHIICKTTFLILQLENFVFGAFWLVFHSDKNSVFQDFISLNTFRW